MANTANYGWHYPVLGDAPNVPSDIQSLATGVDTTLAAQLALKASKSPTQPGPAVWQNGTSNITLTSAFAALMTVSVPDPGYAYYLEVAAQCDFFYINSWTAGSPPQLQLKITLGSVSGTIISQNLGIWGSSTAANTIIAGGCPKRKTALLTGAQTVVLGGMGAPTGQVGAGFNLGGVSVDPTRQYLDVTVLPA
jgi:hypothetical protein